MPDSALVKVLKVGPPNLEIAVGDQRLQLPLDRWVALDLDSEDLQDIPSGLGVTKSEEDAARAKLRGDFSGYTVGEATIDGGTHVFVVGKLEDGPGPLRLDADRVLGRVELFPGTQEQYVREMVRKGNNTRMLAWIFGPIGWPPLLVLGLVLFVRSRKRSAVRP